jgi:uncharacterized protein
MRIILAIVFILPFLLSQSESNNPEVSDQLIGSWEGSLDVFGSELRLVFNLNKMDDGTLSGTMDSPDQESYGIPLSNIFLESNNIEILVASIAGSFTGVLKTQKNSIEGEWTQGQNSFPLTLIQKTKKIIPTKKGQIYTKIQQELLAGSWEGKLELPSDTLTIVFNIIFDHVGIADGNIDSPDQDAFAIPLTNISYRENILRLGSKSISGAFMGSLNEENNTFEGIWYQQQQRISIVLRKISRQYELKRPQTPNKPLPYLEEKIAFKNVFANISLAGTLTLPDSVGIFPAVVLVSGSGAQDRDESIFGHSPFAVIADHLTRKGIAVLRYDDRGVGESSGNFRTATTTNFANDAYAAIHYLKSRKEINPKMIGIIGHSEGGLVAPMVANRVSDLAMIVLVAAPGLTGEEILYHQIEILLKASGEKQNVIEFIKQLTKNIYKIIKEEPDDKIAKDNLVLLYEKTWHEMDEELIQQMEKRGETKNSIKKKIPVFLSPWFRNFLIVDPAQILPKVKCAVLAINGEKDMQVSADENLLAIKNALLKGGNKNVTIKKLNGLNHLLQSAETGLPGEYGKIEETISPSALHLISEWILDQVNTQNN